MMLAPVLTPHGLLMLVQSLEAEGEAPALEPEHGLRLEKALKLPFHALHRRSQPTLDVEQDPGFLTVLAQSRHQIRSNPPHFGTEHLGSPKLFFESGHVPPLLSNFECLFLDHEIVGPLGELLGLAGLSPVFFGLACRHGRSSETNGNPAGPGGQTGLRADPDH